LGSLEKNPSFQVFFNMTDYSSGLASILLSKLREEYPSNILVAQTLLSRQPPQDKKEENTYNFITSMANMIENVDITTLTDIESLDKVLGSNDIVKRKQYLARTYADLTSGMRSNGLKTYNFLKLASSLIMFPRYHFFSLTESINGNIDDLFNPSLSLGKIVINPSQDSYMNSANIFRGDWPTFEVENKLSTHSMNNESRYGKAGFSAYYVNLTGNNGKNSCVSLVNHSSTITSLKDDFNNFEYSENMKKRFSEDTGDSSGMAVEEAKNNFTDLLYEYSQYVTPMVYNAEEKDEEEPY